STWIYRFFLFLGIALLIYHLFFKLAGLILFVIEIFWFIGKPVLRELTEWWGMRREIFKARRAWVTFGVTASIVFICSWPWQGTVYVPAVAVADQEYAAYAPRPAQLLDASLLNGSVVRQGQVLAVFRSPDLELQLKTTAISIELRETQLRRIVGDRVDRARRVVLQEELKSARQRYADLQAEKAQLIVSAPFDGVLRDRMPRLLPGDWVDDHTTLVRVVSQDRSEAHGYLHEDDLRMVQAGAEAVFTPEDPLLPSRDGQIVSIGRTGEQSLDLLYLCSVYGGAVASDRDDGDAITPRAGRYFVRVELDGAPMERVVRGTLLLDGKPESFASAAFRRVMQVLIRETGF
ncbi:MAG: HlyD family efflux transporter periplasmic adaptor subunit, partial [Pseudomonadota bacterium]